MSALSSLWLTSYSSFGRSMFTTVSLMAVLVPPLMRSGSGPPSVLQMDFQWDLSLGSTMASKPPS